MNFTIKIKKFISLITAGSLLLSFIITPTAANAMSNEEATKQYKQIFKNFVLPYSYGQITDSHYAATDRVIINIQDLHCHPQVQKNISNIIETFDNSYGVKKVYLEGAYGHVSTEWINKKTDKQDRVKVLEKMLDTGRLTGAEYYSAISGKTEIIEGLEEKGPYLDNLKRFGNIIENQEKINLILKAIDESLSQLKKKYYTKRQYKLEELSEKYSKGKISAQKYYALLSKHIDKLGIDLSKYENTFTYVVLLDLQKKLDYSKIMSELQSLLLVLKENLPYNAYQMLLDNTDNFVKIDKLYAYIVQISRLYNLDLSVNFPNLDNYFGYIEFSQKINPLELISEEEKLTQEINTRFSETKAQRDVVFLTNFRRYLENYVTSKITSSDYEYYKENINEYRLLWNKYVDNRVLSLLDEYMAEADKFYEINTDRNIYFTKNMFDENYEPNEIQTQVQAKGDVNKIIDNMKDVKEVDIVITGGFHSQTVTEIIKNHGVSYIVITPNVNEGVKLAEQTYYQIAKEQSKISFQTLANLIASLSPTAQSKIFELMDFKGKPQQISQLSQAEKAEILKQIDYAKLLESDEDGAVTTKLLDIINADLQEPISEEMLSRIKTENLPRLLEDRQQLQKVVNVLKQPVMTQSVTLLTDTLDNYIKNINRQINVGQASQTSVETAKSAEEQQQLTMTWLSKILDFFKIKDFDKRQKIINIVENPIIMLGIFFPTIQKMFIRLHGKQNKEKAEEGLSFILKNSGSFVREAVQNVPTMNFGKKIKEFVVLNMRRYTREDVAAAHSSWNKLQLLKKQINDNDVSKDIVFDLFHIINTFNVTDRNLIIKTAFDFVDKKISQDEKIKFLKVLSGNFSYLSKEQENSVVNKIFELGETVSLSDRMKLLRNIIRNYEKFDFTDEQKKQFTEELKKIAGQKNKESKDLFSSLIDKSNYFDNEQRKTISNMVIEEGVDVFTLLFNFDYFDTYTKNKIFDLSVKIIREQKDSYILDSLMEIIYKLNSEQKDIIFAEVINFINSDNSYNKKLKYLKKMIENIKYFNQSQRKEIYDIAGSFISKGEIKETKSLILSLLSTLSADEFSKLNVDFRDNIVNTVLKFKLEDFNNTKDTNLNNIKEIDFNTDETFGFIKRLLQKVKSFFKFKHEDLSNTKDNNIKEINFNTDETFELIKDLLPKVNCLNGEQKNIFFDIIDKFSDGSKLKEQDKVNFLQMIFEQISVLPEGQQDKFKNMAKSFNLQFSSNVIDNNTYTPLISKIANMRDRIVNRYKFFNLNNFSQGSKSDTESLFQNYKRLEEDNLKTLKLLMNLSSKKDLEDLYRSLLSLYGAFYAISLSESALEMLKLIDAKFMPWLFENKDMDIEKEKELHGYNFDTIVSANLEDVSINDLINVIHQTAIIEFKNKMVNVNMRSFSHSYIQNFSKNGYINPEIKQLLSKIVTLNGAMVCFDENTLVISITPIDRHSTTIIVNTDNINRGLSFSFYDAILGRSTSVKSVLERMGFEAELRGTYVNAKLNKTNGLDESVDLTEKFDLLLKMFYITTKYDDKQYLSESLEKYTDDYMTAADNGLEENNILKFNNSIVQNDIFSTVENLNSILRELGLPEISEDDNSIYEEPFSHTKVLGQIGVNKYFNTVIDRAFSEGRIIVDEQGNMVRNKDYNEFENIQNLLSDISAGDDEVLKQASVIDELNKQNGQILKLETKAKVGQLEYQTGYLQLSTGEYLFVKVLKNSVNDMIRYASVELVKQDGQRVFLNGKSLVDKIIAEGYQVYDQPRQKTKIEKENIRKELIGKEIKSANVSKSGNLLGKNNGSVTGKVVFSSDKVDADSILLKEYLSPEDMEGTLKAKGIVLASAMELSHQGLIVKEKGIVATIITGIVFVEREGKLVAEIKYTEYSGNNKNINGIEVEEVVEKTITVSEGDEIAIDGDTGRVIIFDKNVVNGTSKDETKLAEYKKYKDMEKSANKSAEESVVSEETTEQESPEKPIISQNIEDNIKGFDETADKQNFGTKATNLQDMSAIIDEMSKILGIDVRVPYGVMIGAGAFLSILNKNEKFKELYVTYEQAIRTGNKTLANDTAKKMINIIENLSKEELKDFADLIDEKIGKAIANGYVSENDKYAVRSAFKNEDGSKFSAAGVGESKVGVERKKITNALINIVLMSVYGDRSVAYQSSNKQEFIPAALVQQAVDSQKSAVMTVKDGHITISGSWGQGEIVVSGEKAQSVVQVEIDKNGEITISDYVTERQDYQYGLNGEVKAVSKEDSTKEIFSTQEIENMSRIGLFLREKYGYDADIELAMKDGVIYVVQIRPITEKTDDSVTSNAQQDESSFDTDTKQTDKIVPVEQPVSETDKQQTIGQENVSVEQDMQKNVSASEVAVDTAVKSLNPVSVAQNIAIRSISSQEDIALLEQNVISIDQNLVISESELEARNLRSQGIKALTVKTSFTERGGDVIGEINGVKVRAKWNKENNEILFCLKKGVSVDKEDLLQLLVKANEDGVKIDVLDGIKQVVILNEENVVAGVINTIKNVHTDSVMMPSKELKFDISTRKSVNKNNIESICHNEASATEATTFVISAQQAEDCKEQLELLQKEGYKFVINYNSSTEIGEILFDGAKINAQDITDVAKARELLKKLQDVKLIKGIDTRISVKFNKEIYSVLTEDMFNEYGIIPIVDMKTDVIGKKEIEDVITQENFETLLRDEFVLSIVIDEQSKELISKNKEKLKQAVTKKTKYNKGFKAALNSKFDYTVKDVGAMFEAISIDVNADNLETVLNNLDLKSLSNDSKAYVEYLRSKQRYEELLGFIRGIVMNTVADNICEILDLDKEAFFAGKNTKTVQAVLIITIQNMMKGDTVENMYGTMKGSDTMTAQNYLDTVRTKLNGILDKVLLENEDKISDKGTVVASDFDGIPELLMDIYGRKANVTKELKISLGAVKSILAAA